MHIIVWACFPTQICRFCICRSQKKTKCASTQQSLCSSNPSVWRLRVWMLSTASFVVCRPHWRLFRKGQIENSRSMRGTRGDRSYVRRSNWRRRTRSLARRSNQNFRGRPRKQAGRNGIDSGVFERPRSMHRRAS